MGGGILAGALAYRLFVFLLPLALLLVSGLGLYADATDKNPSEVVSDSGITGLIAKEISATASGSHRALIFVLSVPALLYTLGVLYRAIAVVHAIAWHGSGRGVRSSPTGVGVLGGGIVTVLVAIRLEALLIDHGPLGALAALALYVALAGAAWFVVSIYLPHGDIGRRALAPGAVLFGSGMLCVNAFNVYITSRLVEGRSDTYGALGVAAALLFSLYLIGRVIVLSAVLNATVDARRRASG